MGTQGTGRKRSTKKERSTAEDDALNLIAREAEARLAAKRAARAEAREIRMKELERQQKELSDEDERMSVGSRGSVRVEDRDYLEKGSRAASALTGGTLTSLGGTSSRRGSGETAITVDAETSIREIKDALVEVEEKYRKAMVSNAQLDNEKNNLMYQVDTLKDSLMELEELLSESRRGFEEKVKDFEREKHAHTVLQFQFNEMKETLKQSEDLLNDIRQLHIKQEGFVREISDLQETVEWKDKKIGALERQKEYTDAIRVERDELREEVVKLKDILKKHGIVLGPDLNINGEVGEAEGDGTPSADPASQPAQDSQTSPPEGNSMLGHTEETQLRSSGEEEVDPEQHQEMFEEAKDSHLTFDTLCNLAGVSTLETSSEEQQTCLEEESNIEECGLSNDQSITDAKDIIVCSPGLQGIVTEDSSEENVKETETPEGGDVGESETKSSNVDTHTDDIKEACNNLFKEQENKQEDVVESNSESCHQQRDAQDVITESLPDKSVLTVSNTEPQQEPENAEEADNDEAEEISSKSQPQGAAAAAGKKKKRKRRGKKKGGTQEDKTQQKDGTDKEKGKSEKVIESAPRNKGPTAEPEVDVTETLKESRVDQVRNVQDRQEDRVEAVKPTESFSPNDPLKESRTDHVTDAHDKVQTLEKENVKEAEAVATVETSHIECPMEERVDHVTDEQIKEHSLEMVNVEEAEAVAITETFSHIETPKEVKVGHVTDEQIKEHSLEMETVEAVVVVAPAETFSPNETLKESRTDHLTDQRDEEQTLEMKNVEEAEVVATAESFSHIETPMEERVDHATDEQNKEHSLETEAVEAVAPAETFSDVETLKESRTDPRKDEQDEEQTLETEKVKELGSITSPVPETNLNTSDLIDNSTGAESTDGLDKEYTSSVDHSKSETDISINANVIHIESEIVDAEDEVGSIDEIKSEITTNNTENTFETSCKETPEAESNVPSNGGIAADESESTNNSKCKDNMSMSLSSTDSFTNALKSLSGSELSVAVNSNDAPVTVSDGGPEEATETIKDDDEPGAEIEQESFSSSIISCSLDGDDSELKADRTEKEALDGGLREAEGLVVSGSSCDEKSDSQDSASLTKTTDAFDTVKSLVESVAQAERCDDIESQTLQCEDQIDESNAQVSSESEETNNIDMLNTPDSPKEATEIGSPVEQDHSTEESAISEDPEHTKDQQSETQQLHEPSKDESRDNDSSQPTLQDSNEEDGDDDEGQSFDFDDMDIEAAVATSLSESPKQEEVEEGVEVMSDESNSASSGQINRQDESVEIIDEKSTVDGGNQVDTVDTMPRDNQKSLAHEDTMSEKGGHVENVCETQKNVPEKEVGIADEPRHNTEEGKVLNVGDLAVVAENINQAMSLPVEEGLDAFKHEMDLRKSAEQVASNKEPQPTGRDVKKSGKKGKGKGKEECKMS